MAKRGKRYQDVAKLVDTEKLYSPSEAIALVKNVHPPSLMRL